MELLVSSAGLLNCLFRIPPPPYPPLYVSGEGCWPRSFEDASDKPAGVPQSVFRVSCIKMVIQPSAEFDFIIIHINNNVHI